MREAIDKETCLCGSRKNESIFHLLAERRSLWPWADHVLFWGMNVGAIGFITILLMDVRILERVFTPIMSLSILLGLLTYGLRMGGIGKVAEVNAAAL